MNYLNEYLKIFRPRTFKKVLFYLKHLMGWEFYLLKKGKFKEAYNCFWVRLFSIEEGLGLATPFYKINPNWAPYPERIEVEVTTVCRFRCPKCEHTYWKEKQQNMSFDNFKRVIDQFPKLKEVSSTGIGHGFENPEYFKMLEYLKSKSIFVQFFDPLFLLNEKIIRELIKIRANWIWISFDGATKETYEKSQVGSNFETVIENIKTLFKIRKELKSPFPELHFQPIITKYNVKEMPKFVELIGSITKDSNQPMVEVQFINLIPFEENKWLMPEVTEDVLEETRKKAKEFKNLNIEFIKMAPEETKAPIQECLSWTVPFILVDGTVYPCCALTEGNMRQLVKPYALGNIFQTPFKKMWYSKEFRHLIKAIHEGGSPAVCCYLRECPLFKCGKKCQVK